MPTLNADSKPLHSSPACETLFREDPSTKYWLNEVSQRHISKSEIETSTPKNLRWVLQTSFMWQNQTNGKPSCAVCKLQKMSLSRAQGAQGLQTFFIKHVLESWLIYLCHSRVSILVPFALPLPCRATPRCVQSLLISSAGAAHLFFCLYCLLVLKIVKEANQLCKPPSKGGTARSISEG